MIKQLVLAAIVLSVFAQSTAEAVEPGRYSLSFRMGSDFGGTQEIELLNIRPRTNGYGSFDVNVSAPGALMRFAEDGQTVQGLYHHGKIIFIIPSANVVDVTGFKFVANDVAGARNYEGSVSIFGPSEGEAKEGPFPFRMERVAVQ